MTRWLNLCWPWPLVSGLLSLAGCGGSDAPAPAAPQRFGLQLASTSDVAGLQWTMSLDPIHANLVDITRRAETALGPDARVMNRPKDVASTEPVVEWAIYAKASPGSTGWLVMEHSVSNTSAQPTIQTVICANAHGNPVPCTLRWVAM